MPWIPYKVGLCLEAPCTHKVGSWSHHLIEDAKDLVDGVEDPGDDVEALVENKESLDGLEKH